VIKFNIKHKYLVLYNISTEILNYMKPDGVEIDNYFEGTNDCTSMNSIFERLCETLQNRSRLPNVIKFGLRKDIIAKILFNFNPQQVKLNYDVESLYEKFKEQFEISNPDNKKNLWYQYTRYIISGSEFLSEFDDVEDFKKFVQVFSYNKLTKASLPMLLEKEVIGLGFALACDFLKEIGYSDYPKPDVHINRIMFELGLSADNDFSSYKSVIEMADSLGETAFKIDKVLWLVSSGNFYFDNVKVSSRRTELIEKTKEIFRVMEGIEKGQIDDRYYSQVLEYLGLIDTNYYDKLNSMNLSEELERDFSDDVELTRALLTAIFREDHFSGGSLRKQIESGIVMDLFEVIYL